MTYNQIITLFENIANAHKFIKSFGHGEAWEINSNDTFKDYILWVIPVDSTTLTNTKNRTLTLLVFRRVDKAKRYETEILSNCEQILDDVIKTFRNHSNDFDLVNDPVALPFKEEFGDWCAGWRADLIIETDFANNYCDVPSDEFVSPTPNNNASYVIDEDGNVVYTLLPGQYYTLNPMATNTAEDYVLSSLSQSTLQTPAFIYGVYAPNVRLVEGDDYTVSGNTFTFIDPNYIGIKIIFVYSY